MATKKKRSTKKTVKKVAKKARAKGAPRRSVAVLEAEIGTLQELVAQLVESGNRLGANADALQQALVATYPRIAAGSHPTKEDVKGLVLDKAVSLLSYDSPDGALLDTLARLFGALS